MKFLIVDDNSDLAMGLADVLELDGHSVTVATTAAEAREAFAPGEYDNIFLDMKLPDGSGLDLYYEFHEQSPDTKVVLMTGYRLEQLLQQLVGEGSVALLRKPFTMDQVYRALNDTRPRGMVLIADDDPDFADGLSEFLQQHGHRTLVVHDGGGAVKAVKEGSIDVMILDLRLPVLCGAGVYLELKKLGCEVPTILVTGYPDEENETIDQFRSMSVTNCLFKPFHPTDIMTALETMYPGDGGRA